MPLRRPGCASPSCGFHDDGGAAGRTTYKATQHADGATGATFLAEHRPNAGDKKVAFDYGGGRRMQARSTVSADAPDFFHIGGVQVSR